VEFFGRFRISSSFLKLAGSGEPKALVVGSMKSEAEVFCIFNNHLKECVNFVRCNIYNLQLKLNSKNSSQLELISEQTMEKSQNLNFGKLVESIEGNSYPVTPRHLIHDCLKVKQIDLVVDKQHTSGGDIAFIGSELNQLGIQKAIVTYAKNDNAWEHNPIKMFALILDSDALAIAKEKLTGFQNHIERVEEGEVYATGSETISFLSASPTNDKGLLVVSSKSEPMANEMIRHCEINNESVALWLRASVNETNSDK
jgi:hypothetical protein